VAKKFIYPLYQSLLLVLKVQKLKGYVVKKESGFTLLSVKALLFV